MAPRSSSPPPPQADLRVLRCPACGAPLPNAKEAEETTCRYCGETSKLEAGEQAARKAERTAAELETFIAVLSKPPGPLQRFALVLARPWVFWVGVPALGLALLKFGQWPMRWLGPWWEARHPERLLHLLPPTAAWLIETGGVVLGLLVLLLWGLFGSRLDVRRELQGALASRPSTTPGGPSFCRHCGRPLEVPPGTRAVRCGGCDADNLVKLPPGWVKRAERFATKAHLSITVARAALAAERRAWLRAAAWRAPVVALLTWFLVAPAYAKRNAAGWASYALRADGVGVFRLITKPERDVLEVSLEGLARCGLNDGRSPFRLDRSRFCSGGRCTLAAMVALRHGETLRLDWSVPAEGVEASLRLAPLDYGGSALDLWEGFGDEVRSAPLVVGAPLTPAFSAQAPLDAWYRLTVQGPPGASVQLCVVSP